MPHNIVNNPGYLTTGDVARMLNVSIPTVHRMVKNKEIPGVIQSPAKWVRFDPVVFHQWCISNGFKVHYD